jgi:hypothetical protein
MMQSQSTGGWVIPCALFLCATSATGCGQKKAAECNALITVINVGVQTLEKTPKTDTDPNGLGDLKGMAQTMDKVATDIGGVPLTIPEIRKFSADYQKMVKDIAKAERDLAVAAQERDQAKRSAAEIALDGAVKPEDPLVDSINKFCQAP